MLLKVVKLVCHLITEEQFKGGGGGSTLTTVLGSLLRRLFHG